jgi:hypothetical protein
LNERAARKRIGGVMKGEDALPQTQGAEGTKDAWLMFRFLHAIKP